MYLMFRVSSLQKSKQWVQSLLGCVLAAVLLAQAPVAAHAQTAPELKPAARPNPITGATPDATWEEEFAYTLGVQAYTYAFPWTYNSLMRWRWATVPMADLSTESGLVLPNVLVHQRKLTDAKWRNGGRPNSDTLYSSTWADLTKEPMIITLPDMGKRYFSVELVGFDSDNYDYIGTRATGSHGGKFALVGPNWKGSLPKGVKAVRVAPTNWVLVLLRILIDDPQDYPTVHQLQDQVSLVPLSQYLGKATPGAAPDPKTVLIPPVNRKSPDPLQEWKVINRLLTENPPPAYENQMMKMFAQIGVGPGQDVEKMGPAIQRGLVRALATGRMIVTSAPANNVGRTTVNGWGISPSTWGRTGVNGQYLMRDAQSLGGFVVHDPIENIYPVLMTDANGEPLQDSHRYELTFKKEELPLSDAFWSVTLYDSTFNFVDNPINRYTLGNRSKGMKFNADGSLTMYIQKDAPEADKASNWLPALGNFHLVMRVYLPKKPMLDGSWKPPLIKRID